MLYLHTARESIDKEKYLYEQLSGKSFILVPEQYTLVAEEQALHYLGVDCLLDVEITTLERLGRRILAEEGRENVPLLNQYGRFLLLYRIIRRHRDELEVFHDAAGKDSFVEMVSDFIADFKQQDCSLGELAEMLEAQDEESLLSRKLRELQLILEAYETALQGKYTDNEDYAAMYTEAIAGAQLLRDRSVWIYGFDTITAKFRDAVVAMAARTEVHFLVNESDYGLEQRLMALFAKACEAAAVPLHAARIPEAYRYDKSETIARLEAQLFRDAGRGTPGAPGEVPGDDLMLVECANPACEAESAAACICTLLREDAYRMRDIVIICNDESGRQPLIRRIFGEYNLPVFVDARRGITDAAAAHFLIGQLEFVLHEGRSSALMMLLKTGLTDISRDQIERLEKYANNYHIRGRMWGQPFRYGAFEYGEEAFAALEETRAEILEPLEELRALVRGAKRVQDFAEGFRDYLESRWQLAERMTIEAERQLEQGFPEEAQNTLQGYEACLDILDQVVEILGEEAFDLSEFVSLYRKGLEAVQVGIIPPTLDGLTMGTMIRTRPGPARAVFLLGANEGVLPLTATPEGLFSVEEKAFFAAHEFPLGRLDDIQILEEQVAMYRMISRPSEKLYVSWSMTDTGGEEAKPSVLVDALRSACPQIPVRKDIVSAGYGLPLAQAPRETLRHVLEHLRERPSQALPTADEEAAQRLTRAILGWYEQEDPERLSALLAAARDENRAEPLPRTLAKRLFAKGGRDFSFSASRLERYCRCPFRHFVLYGLRPLEDRAYRSGGREIGDIYHECLMRVSRRLTDSAAPFRHSDAEIAGMVQEELAALASEYRGGLFLSDGRESYRMERIQEICTDAVLAMAQQLREGRLKLTLCEERFGRGCRFEPITCSLRGERVYIEGKIDRVDLFESGDVRVIDYKTGPDKLDIEQMRSGYKMQLMVYLQGVCSAERRPAGIFYFNIADLTVNVNGKSGDKQDKEIEKAETSRFALKGAYIDEPEILEEMPARLLDSSSKGLDRESFQALERDVYKAIEKISEGIISGDIRIEPTELRKGQATERECSYCSYRPICRFDLGYRHNRYRSV